MTLDEYFRHMSYYDRLYNPYCGVAQDSRNDSILLYNRLNSNSKSENSKTIQNFENLKKKFEK